MQMDKIDAQIICRICSMYNVYFEFLLDIELEEKALRVLMNKAK